MEIYTCRAPHCTNPRDIKQRSTLCTMHRVRWARHKSLDLPISSFPEGTVMTCRVHGNLNEEQAHFVKSKQYYQCKECKKIRLKKYEERNPYRIPTRNFKHIGKKGYTVRITTEEFKLLYDKQNGLCAICNKPETAKSTRPASKNPLKRLALDHCHRTLKIRKFLCHKCNNIIGFADDSIELLQSAIDYLIKHQ